MHIPGRCCLAVVCALAAAVLQPSRVSAETGYDAWLRYAPLPEVTARQYREIVPAVVVVLGDDGPVRSAGDEIVRGMRGLLGRTLRLETRLPHEPAIVLGTRARCRDASSALFLDGHLEPDAYHVKLIRSADTPYLVVTADTDRGVLYGAFALLRRMALGQPLTSLDEKQTPAAPIRWVNQWDNLDGTIERGYGGRSIFWEDGHVARGPDARVATTAVCSRRSASTAVAINNVNANPRVLSPELSRRSRGSPTPCGPGACGSPSAIDFGSPQNARRAATLRPARSVGRSRGGRRRSTSSITAVPDFGGFVLKADSEGRVGPSHVRPHARRRRQRRRARAGAARRSHLLSRVRLRPSHGLAATRRTIAPAPPYDNFHDLDGKFDDNVIIQIKHGPIDFQVREPASPLFGALEQTNQAIELQITQEYMGQARHTGVPGADVERGARFRSARATAGGSPVKAIVAGKTFHRPTGGFVGVANVGLDDNWSGNHLSQANLYGFGRLAWNPDLTRASDRRRVDAADLSATIRRSCRPSRHATRARGAPTRTTPGRSVCRPSPTSSATTTASRSRRQSATAGDSGTAPTTRASAWIGRWRPAPGYIGQYSPGVPEAVRIARSVSGRSAALHASRAVHARAASTARPSSSTSTTRITTAPKRSPATSATWTTLEGPRRRRALPGRCSTQLDIPGRPGDRVARRGVDVVLSSASGIRRCQGRVGHYPGRIEAESARLDGYVVKPVTPWETASGGQAVECGAASCTATFTYDGAAGWRDLVVQYFDTNTGASRFRVRVGTQIVDEWTAADHVPTRKVDGSSSARRVITGLALRPGDTDRDRRNTRTGRRRPRWTTSRFGVRGSR